MKSNSGPKINRRDLLKGIGKGSALVTIVAAAPSVAQAASHKKVRYGMVIDVRRCSGCQACSIACKAEFDVPIGGVRSWVELHEAGAYPTKNFMWGRFDNYRKAHDAAFVQPLLRASLCRCLPGKRRRSQSQGCDL